MMDGGWDDGHWQIRRGRGCGERQPSLKSVPLWAPEPSVGVVGLRGRSLPRPCTQEARLKPEQSKTKMQSSDPEMLCTLCDEAGPPTAARGRALTAHPLPEQVHL